MAWVRIEDAVTEHRKHLRAGPAAAWLWVCGIAYCQRQMSDGFIPVEAVPLLGVPRGFSRLIETLVEVGLFDRVDGGYRVHDYHDYNETREEAKERKATLSGKRAAAGRLGGLQSGAARKQSTEAKGTNEQANAKQVAEANRSPIPTRPDPTPPNPSRSDDEKISARQTAPHRSEDAAALFASASDERFERFWAAYPNKKGKALARKTWARLHPSEAVTDMILTALAQQRFWPEWRKEGGRFVPHPSTWLNDGRWDDEPMCAERPLISDIDRENMANAQEALSLMEARDGGK